MVRLWEPSRTGEASLQNLTFAFKIVRYCGLWRTDGDTKAYTLYSFVATLTFILAYVKLFVFCFSATGDMELFIEAISIASGIAATFVGTFLILAYSSKFTEVVERIRAFILFVHTGEEHWKYLARGHSTFEKRRVTMYYLVTGVISLLSCVLRPVVSHLFFGQEADFPIRQLVMFDDNSVLSYILQYLAQIVICSSLWATVMSMDVFCFNIILGCSHQLKVLSSMILNLMNTVTENVELLPGNKQAECHFEQSRQSMECYDMTSDKCEDIIASRGYSVSLPQIIFCSEQLRSMEKTLSTLFEWHQEILKTTGEMAKHLNAVMLIHYLFTSITLCMLTYDVQNYRGQTQLIYSSSTLLFIFLRMLILGWSSSELASESVLVSDAAYFCKWYDISLNAKKTLIIMMARAQRPLIIKAGPTGSLSLETCKKLMEAAYSYLNVLKNMK